MSRIIKARGKRGKLLLNECIFLYFGQKDPIKRLLHGMGCVGLILNARWKISFSRKEINKWSRVVTEKRKGRVGVRRGRTNRFRRGERGS